MRRARVGLVAVTAALLTFLVPIGGQAAEAASQPPSLIPTDAIVQLTQPLQPVLEIVSPIVWPACANAVLVSVLPGAVGLQVPPQVSTITGPLLVLCGSVPIPATNTRHCALDAQAQALLAKLTTPLLGSGLPVEVAPEKWVTGLLDNIVDRIDQPAIPKGSTVAATFQCVDPGPETTTTTTLATSATTAGGSGPASVDALPPSSDLAPPTFAQLEMLPPVEPSLAAAPTNPAAPTAPLTRLISEPRFRYPVVMAVPLLLLALLVFFGRALTRPLQPAERRPRSPSDRGGLS